MPAALHIIALVISSACFVFSLRRMARSQWALAAIDAAMVCVMLAAVSFPAGLAQLCSGVALIVLAMTDALLTRIRASTVSPAHVHRALCLLIMGAATLVMLGHEHISSTSHAHLISMSIIGFLGLAVVGALVVVIRRHLTFASVGMLVATGVMSVATLAA